MVLGQEEGGEVIFSLGDFHKKWRIHCLLKGRFMLLLKRVLLFFILQKAKTYSFSRLACIFGYLSTVDLEGKMTAKLENETLINTGLKR